MSALMAWLLGALSAGVLAFIMGFCGAIGSGAAQRLLT